MIEAHFPFMACVADRSLWYEAITNHFVTHFDTRIRNDGIWTKEGPNDRTAAGSDC